MKPVRRCGQVWNSSSWESWWQYLDSVFANVCIVSRKDPREVIFEEQKKGAKRYGIKGRRVPVSDFESVFKNVMQSFFFVQNSDNEGRLYEIHS